VIHATYLQSSSTLSQGQYRHELLEGNRVHRLCHMVIEPCFQCATLIFVLPPACHGDEHHALAPVLVSNAPRRLTLADWHLFDQSEAWREATLGTREERKAKLASSAIRQAMKREYDSGEFTKSRPNLPFEIEISTYVAAHVTRADLKGSQGRTLAQIAAAQGKHLIDAMLDLSLADDLNTEWRTPQLNVRPEFAREVMGSPYTMAGLSDGGAHMKFLTAAIWPTDLLTWMVRETGILTLEDAHFRLSGMPAWAAGFTDRGLLREGLAADVIVYDMDALAAGPVEIRHDLPAGEWRRVQCAQGYRWIMVNGRITFDNGTCTGRTPGRLLRGGAAR
jgi:N-acyl-D-amino-acid deacylase